MNKFLGTFQNELGNSLQSSHFKFPYNLLHIPLWRDISLCLSSLLLSSLPPEINILKIPIQCQGKCQDFHCQFWLGLFRSLVHQFFTEETRCSWEAFSGYFIYVSMCCFRRRDGHRLQAGNLLLLGSQPKHFFPVPMEQFCPIIQSGKAIKMEPKWLAMVSYLVD